MKCSFSYEYIIFSFLDTEQIVLIYVLIYYLK